MTEKNPRCFYNGFSSNKEKTKIHQTVKQKAKLTSKDTTVLMRKTNCQLETRWRRTRKQRKRAEKEIA